MDILADAPLRVLVADDDASARQLLEAFLTQLGFHVQAVTDGDAAWQILQRPNAPRLVLLDWKMPGLDGPEVCRRVRAAHPHGPRYLMLITGHAGASHVIEGLEAGADDFVTKPFDHRELRARIGVGVRVVYGSVHGSRPESAELNSTRPRRARGSPTLTGVKDRGRGHSPNPGASATHPC